MLTVHALYEKNVINMEKGIIIGTVDDVEFDEASARVEALLIYGRPRLFGLLGRDADVRIPWGEVLSFGQDVIMVSTAAEPPPPRPRGLRGWLAAL